MGSALSSNDSHSSGKDLWQAARYGNINKLRSILESSRSSNVINWKDPSFGLTPLMIATQRNRLAIVKLLRRAGADVNARDEGSEKNTAMHYAAFYDRSEILLELLKFPTVNRFVINATGLSALDIARIGLAKNVLKILNESLTIRQGYLHISKGGNNEKWKKRFVRVLKCSTEDDELEIVTFASPEELRPRKVMLLSAAAQRYISRVQSSTIDRSSSFWKMLTTSKQRPFVFEFSTPLRFQRISSSDQNFSRSNSVGTEREFRFACESLEELDGWMSIFGSRNNIVSSQAEVDLPSENNPSAPEFYEESRHSSRLFPITSKKSTGGFTASAPEIEEGRNNQEEEERHQSDCIICMDAPANAVCVPCGHLSSCYSCMSKMQQQSKVCPMCRVEVSSVIQVYTN